MFDTVTSCYKVNLKTNVTTANFHKSKNLLICRNLNIDSIGFNDLAYILWLYARCVLRNGW